MDKWLSILTISFAIRFCCCTTNCLCFFVVCHTFLRANRCWLKSHNWQFRSCFPPHSFVTTSFLTSRWRSSCWWCRGAVWTDSSKLDQFSRTLILWYLPRPSDFKRSSVSILMSGIPGIDLSRDGSRWSRVVSFLALRSANILRFRSSSARLSAMIVSTRCPSVTKWFQWSSSGLLTLFQMEGGERGGVVIATWRTEASGKWPILTST